MSIFVQLRNFKKYNNPRKDVQSTPWFRMQNSWMEHPTIFGLDNDQRLLWPYLLGAASDKMCAVVEISVSHAAAITKSTPERVRETLDYFQSRELIWLIESPAHAVPDTDSPDESPPSDEPATNPLRTRYGSGTKESHNGTERNGTKKKSNPPASPSRPDPLDVALADDWVAFAKSRSDTAKPDRGKYADAMRQMRRLGLSANDILDTLAWIKASEFWAKVAWSPIQLVKAKDGVRKLDTIRAQMATSRQRRDAGYTVLTEKDLNEL